MGRRIDETKPGKEIQKIDKQPITDHFTLKLLNT
jgi:hypothetical protein